MSDDQTPRRRSRAPARSLAVLAVRLEECENDIHDMKSDLKTALTEFGKLKDRLNIWGAAIIGAMVAGGLISDEAGAVLKMVFGGG